MPKKAKKKKKKRERPLIPGLPIPRRRSTSLQPSVTTAVDGSTVFSCPQCHTLFNNREAIETHLSVHRSERPFVCTDCGAALKRKEHLDRHRSSHVTERPHPCPVCNKTFKRIVSYFTVYKVEAYSFSIEITVSSFLAFCLFKT